MENNVWENFSTYDFNYIYIGGLIDHYFFFTIDLDLYRIDMTDYKLSLIQEYIYEQFDYSMTNTNDTIFLFGGDFDNTNLLAQLSLNENKDDIAITYYQDFSYPKVRTFHSFTQINDYLYLFGGMSQGKYFNDLWVYNIKDRYWTSSVTEGAGPSERADHAAASYGDVLLIWGGEGSSGYFSDMFMYNTLTYTWSQIIPSSKSFPSNRKGACMVFEMPSAYIFGGTTNYGVSGEFWEYSFTSNSYNLVSKYRDSGVSDSNCLLENKIFYSFCGSGPKGHILHYYLQFNFTSSTWSTTYWYQCHTRGINIKLGNCTIDFGGRENYYSSSSEFILNTGTDSISYWPGYSPYDVGFAYVGSIIYFLYGGSTTIYGDLDYNRPDVNFVAIDTVRILADNNLTLVCSPGYYFSNFTCVACPAGTYASGFGNYKCNQCGKGKYNSQIAATSDSQCYLCSYGTFNDRLGASLCLACPSGFLCDIGSQIPKSIVYSTSINAINPPNYITPDYSSIVIGIQLSLGLVSLVIIALFYIFAIKRIEILDIYTQNHTYNIGDAITLQKTKIGGIFSLFFFCIALVIAATILLNYYLNNTKETKALQPLLVLKEQVKNFESNMEIIVSFNGYGDSCVTDSGCTPKLSITPNNFKTLKSSFFSCSFVETSCIITFYCFGCEINSLSSISIILQERYSYASSISVNLTSTSSIPDFVSSSKAIIYTTNHELFIGFTPTNFYFTLIPSYFTSTVNSLVQSSGYHVSMDTPPVQGSQYAIQSTPEVTSLQATVYFTESSSGLYTNRYPNQSFVILISGLLGSVTGAMGGIAFLMKLCEGNIIKYKKNRKHRVDYLELKNQRSILVDSISLQTTITTQKSPTASNDSKILVKFK